MCSVERARAPACPRTAGCSPTPAPTATSTGTCPTGTRSPGRRRSRSAARGPWSWPGVGIDDVDVVDLYSCFPSAVQLGAASLGLDIERQLTRTGGLAFAGGPWNNYVMHGIATVVDELRERPASRGSCGPTGATRPSTPSACTRRRRPSRASATSTRRTRSTPCPRRELAEPADAAGPATIEAYTVMHARDGAPEQAIAACLLADGRRAWGTSSDQDVLTSLLDGEWVGTPATLAPDGALHL